MKKLLYALILPFFFFSQTYAQSANGTISGKVLDPSGEVLSFANVALFNVSDSSLVKAAFTKEDGEFELYPVPAGAFNLQISSFELKSYSSEPITLKAGQSLELPTISMEVASTEMESVQITAKKPMVTVKPDMTVFNVEGNPIAANSDALDLLRKSPGVMVDNNDNIQVLGKSGVRILINGKPSPLTGQDLASLLKSMSSDQIEAIEIITNPSAKYDAEGNGGVINIRLRRDKRMGTSANLNLGYAVGVYSRYNGGLNVNFRGKKLSAFGNINNYTGGWNEMINIYREQSGLTIDQEAKNPGTYFNNRFHGGLDYQINKQHSVGFQARGGKADRKLTSSSIAEISAGEQIQNFLVASNTEDRDFFDHNYNLNYKFVNEEGSNLTVDLDYGGYRISTESYQPNTYLAPDAVTQIEERNFRTITPTEIDIVTAKTDYERKLWGGQLSLGAKASMVTTDNTFDFYNVLENEDILDTDRSNQFIYTENVNAAYVSFQRPYKKFNFSGGLRAEQTNSLGELIAMQSTENDRVERNYLSLFPSGGVTYQANQVNSFRINYSRRVDRPNYENLNPFEFRLDELTYRRGNPFLQPQFTHSIQATHTYKYALNTTLSYSVTNDFISDLIDTTEVSRAFQTTENIAKQQVVSLNVSYPKGITKWWNTFTNLTGTYTKNEGDFGNGKVVNISQPAFTVYHQSSFTLPKDFSVQVSAYYQSAAIFAANLRMDPISSVDAGISWSFLEKRGNITLTAADVFWGQRWHGVQEFGGLYFNANGGNDSRQFKARLSWLFGNSNVKAKKRKTGLEDESGRVGGSGGK